MELEQYTPLAGQETAAPEKRSSNGHHNRTASAPRLHRSAQPTQLRKVYHLTEMGNSDRFLDEHGKEVLYCPSLGWLVYDGVRWVTDSEHVIEEKIQTTIRSMYREAAQMLTSASELADPEERKRQAQEAEALLHWAKKSETDHMTRAVMSLSRPHVVMPLDRFDIDPWLLNVLNGTIEMRTGTLREHHREDYLLKLAPVEYSPAAAAPVYQAFLQQVMCGNQELISYLQEVFGYCLTGDTGEQVWFTVKGGGQNGKSTLLETFGKLLGAKIGNGYALEMSPESITMGSITPGGSDATPDIARLPGARYVVASETEQGARIKSALIKRMTGCDMIYARQPYHTGFQFTPSFKFFLDTNHQPQVRDTSKGFWRRVRVVPFNYIVPDGEKDKQLMEKLEAEFSGILAWALEGLRRFIKQGGLSYPTSIRLATEGYQQEQDILGLFLREQCIIERSAYVASQDLYNTFKDWVEENMGERSMAQRSFSQAMYERGYTSKRQRTGYIWLGLRRRTLNDMDPEPDPETLGGGAPVMPSVEPQEPQQGAPEPVEVSEHDQETEAALDALGLSPDFLVVTTTAPAQTQEHALLEQVPVTSFIKRRETEAEEREARWEELPSQLRQLWVDKAAGEDADLSRRAFALTALWIKKHFPGCAIQSSPGETGHKLINHTLPWGTKQPRPYAYPAAPEEIQRLFAATTHHPYMDKLYTRQPRSIGALAELDARVAYGAYLVQGLMCLPCLPSGSGSGVTKQELQAHLLHDTVDEYVPYRPGRYLARVTVPDTWAHIGLAPRSTTNVRGAPSYDYPNTPGLTFDSWLDYRELALLLEQDWDLQIKERILFAPDSVQGSRPLRVYAERMQSGLMGARRLGSLAGKDAPAFAAMERMLRAILYQTVSSWEKHDNKRVQIFDTQEQAVEAWQDKGCAGSPPARTKEGSWKLTYTSALSVYQAHYRQVEWAVSVYAGMATATRALALRFPAAAVLSCHADALYLDTSVDGAAAVVNSLPEDTGECGRFRVKHGPVTLAPALQISSTTRLRQLLLTAEKEARHDA